MANGEQSPPPGYPPQAQPPPSPQTSYPPASNAQGPVSPQGRPLASWGQRVGAAFIDFVVVIVPAFIIMAIAGVGAFAASDIDPVTDELVDDTGVIATLVVTAAIVSALMIAYQVYFNGSEKGQTVGKKALDIQVRSEATGGPIGYGTSFLRSLVAAALGFVWIGSLVDLLFPLWDPKRQTLHDKAVGSLVVDTN